MNRLLNLIDLGVCLILLVDFVYRFAKARNKLVFMKWGWIDLVSSIPALDYFRAGRSLRFIRLLRLIRAFKSTRVLVNYIFRRKARGTFAMALTIAILMIIFSSPAILQAEDHANSNIKTAEDALWWSYTTITTAGYGDCCPVTTEGRIIAVLLMTVGVGLFGTCTAYVASWFVEERSSRHRHNGDSAEQ